MFELSTMISKEKEEWKKLHENDKLDKYQKALEAKQNKMQI